MLAVVAGMRRHVAVLVMLAVVAGMQRHVPTKLPSPERARAQLRRSSLRRPRSRHRPALLSQTCAGAPIEFGKPCLLKLGDATTIVTFVATVELRLPWRKGVEARTEVGDMLAALLKHGESKVPTAAIDPEEGKDTDKRKDTDNEESRADLALQRLADFVTSASDNHRIAKAAMMLIASPMVLVLVLPSAEDNDKKPPLYEWKLCAVPIAHLRPVGEEHRKDSVAAEKIAHSYFIKPLAKHLNIRSADTVKPLHVLQFFNTFMPHATSW